MQRMFCVKASRVEFEMTEKKRREDFARSGETLRGGLIKVGVGVGVSVGAGELKC
jgi:hypothetical protein